MEEKEINLLEENWKDIPGYEGLYQASNHGRFKSLRFGKIINPTFKRKTGVLGLRGSDGISKSYTASRIIGQMFISNPENHPIIQSIGNPKNLHPNNLQWISHSDMATKAAQVRVSRMKLIRKEITCEECKEIFVVRNNTKRKYCSRNCSKGKLTDKGRERMIKKKLKKVILKKGDYKQIFNSVAEAAAFLEIKPCTVSNVLAGRYKKAAGYSVVYKRRKQKIKQSYESI